MQSKDELAWELRRKMTPSEALLWARVRNNGLAGLHFRRQHVIAGVIADFYCHSARLVVEVDGPIHQRLVENDTARDARLQSIGITVLRVANEDVASNIEAVLRRIVLASQRP